MPDLRVLGLRRVFALRNSELRAWQCTRAVFGIAAFEIIQELDVAVSDAEVDLACGEVYDETVDSRESCVEA